jgi:hypothetical protein
MPSDRIVRIDFEHNEVHRGDSYTVNLVDTSMADTETINIAFKTPNTTKYINMSIDWVTKAGGHLELIEAPTWTNQSGTSIAIINRNRVSSNSSGLLHDLTTTTFAAASKVSANVTTILTTNATTIDVSYLFGSATKGEAESRGHSEFILNADTQYVIRYTADGGTNAGFIKLIWNEYKDSAI